MFLPLLLPFLSVTTAHAAHPSAPYNSARALRIPTSSNITSLLQLQELISSLSLPVWKGVLDGKVIQDSNVDIVVPAAKAATFDKRIGEMGIEVTVMHEDLGRSIESEMDGFGTSGDEERVAATAANLTWFNAYHPYTEHLAFLSDLQAQYPANAEIVTAGNSNAGRPITGIHFWGAAGKGKSPAVVFHGTVHAREWITTMTTEYLAYALLSNHTTSAEIKKIVDRYDFYIFPVVNPDGFVYTQTTDRLWRKNRQSVGTSSCVGRDINRNWPYQWAVTGGASTNPCDETFKGLSEGDATENIALRNYINKLASTTGVQLYIDIHSYSQLFMTPYGYTCTVLSPQNSVLQSLARGVVSAIRSLYGTVYDYGPICTTIYKATGSSVDYVNDVTGAKYTFTIELRDTGRNGFVLPKEEILPTGRETWEGIRWLLGNMG